MKQKVEIKNNQIKNKDIIYTLAESNSLIQSNTVGNDVVLMFYTIYATVFQCLKDEEKRLEDEYNLVRLAQAKSGIMMERELERKRKQLESDQAKENLRLANEQKSL